MIVQNVKGQVTFNGLGKSKKGNEMRTLKILQMDAQGNGKTFALYLTETALFQDVKVGQQISIPELKIEGNYFCSVTSR